MKRRLFNSIAAVSLLLALVTATTWVTPLKTPVPPVWKRSTPVTSRHLSARIMKGRWTVAVISPGDPAPDPVRAWGGIRVYDAYASSSSPAGPLRLGNAQVVSVDPPMSLILPMIVPAAWLIAWLCRRRRPLAGHCRTCGYDLRATPDRCPECGTAPTEVAA